MIRIISYGTKKKHGESIKRLRDSCKALDVDCFLKTIPDNFFEEDRFKYLYKPTFIRMTLEKLGEPVIWMDADSYLTAVPKVEDIDIDFDFGYIKSPSGSHKWFADSCHIHTLTNIPFLKKWEAFCQEEKGFSDHTALIKTHDFMERKYPFFKSKDVSDWFKGCYIRNYKTYDEIHY